MPLMRLLCLLTISSLIYLTSCKEDSETPALTLQDIDQEIQSSIGAITITSTITFNRSLTSEDAVFYTTNPDEELGEIETIDDFTIRLSHTFDISEPQFLSVGTSITSRQGEPIAIDPIYLSTAPNGDYWRIEKSFGIAPNLEGIVPFVINNTTYLPGLNYDASYKMYALDMSSFALRESENLPIETNRWVGFQLGNNGYIGNCIREVNGNTSSCTSEFITYIWENEQWTANTDTIEGYGMFRRQFQTAYTYNNTAYIYSGSGYIYQYDPLAKKWNIIFINNIESGAPIAQVINDELYLGVTRNGYLAKVDPVTGDFIEQFQYPGEDIPDYNTIDVNSFVIGNDLYISHHLVDYKFNTLTKEWSVTAKAFGNMSNFFEHNGSIYQIGSVYNLDYEETAALARFYPKSE